MPARVHGQGLVSLIAASDLTAPELGKSDAG